MPELFCGFPRVAATRRRANPVACFARGLGPPASCSSWSAPCSDYVRKRPNNQITLSRPTLPGWLTWLEVRGLRVSNRAWACASPRAPTAPAVELLARDGDAELVVRRCSAAEIQEEAADERDDERGADRGVFALAGPRESDQRGEERGARRERAARGCPR